MGDVWSRMVEFGARLLAGGTFEIVLLCVLVVLAIILLLIALFVAWKLIVLLAKGLAWLARTLVGAGKGARARAAERRLSEPPPVAVAWRTGAGPALGTAVREARRRAGPEAMWLVVTSGGGFSDLCQSTGLGVPTAASLAFTAADGLVLVDAARASPRDLRRLGQALPPSRAFDGIAVLVDDDAVAGDALARATTLARSAGLRAAVHVVLSSAEGASAWRIVEPGGEGASEVCASLGEAAARAWLGGAPRSGLEVLARMQNRKLPEALAGMLSAAPSAALDIASVSIGPEGLVRAGARCAARTRPAALPGLFQWIGVGGLTLGLALSAAAAVQIFAGAESLDAVVESAARETRSAWLVDGFDTRPTGARTYRFVRLAERLTAHGRFAALVPTKALLPMSDSPRDLAAAVLESYLLVPLASAIEARSDRVLAPRKAAHEWLVDAERVDGWLVAWEGLEHEPAEVDVALLLEEFFGGADDGWPERPERTLVESEAALPPRERGGLDPDRIRASARERFIASMRLWAEDTYTNGPVARHARTVASPGRRWSARHEALRALRSALEDPAQAWLTAEKDDPDYLYEVRIYGRSIAMDLLGETTTVEAKAAVSELRIAARRNATAVVAPGLGPVLTRRQGGTGQSGALAMTEPAAAWLILLDAFHQAGFATLPALPETSVVRPGAVTLAPGTAARVRAWLAAYDRVVLTPPPALPPAIMLASASEVEADLGAGVAGALAASVIPLGGPLSHALGTKSDIAQIEASIAALAEIGAWLDSHGGGAPARIVARLRAELGAVLLGAGLALVEEEDPLGVFVDEGADREAAVRRLARGLERLRTLRARYAERHLAAGLEIEDAAAVEWAVIGRDLEGYDRGDAGSALSVLEGLARAWAEDHDKACASPRSTHAAYRDDYVARVVRRYTDVLDGRCDALARARAEAAYARVADYFERHALWRWPYTKAKGTPDVPPAVLRELVGLVRDAAPALAMVEARHVSALERTGALFSDPEEALALRFALEWRTRPSEEHLAEHLIGFGLEGAERGEDGTYTWRYGSPATLWLQLARHSPYRFVRSVAGEGLRFEETPAGAGALLRLLADADAGALAFKADVTGPKGERAELRITARAARDDGGAFVVPDLREIGPGTAHADAGGERLGDPPKAR